MTPDRATEVHATLAGLLGKVTGRESAPITHEEVSELQFAMSLIVERMRAPTSGQVAVSAVGEKDQEADALLQTCWFPVEVRTAEAVAPQLVLQPIPAAGQRLDVQSLCRFAEALLQRARPMRLLPMERQSSDGPSNRRSRLIATVVAYPRARELALEWLRAMVVDCQNRASLLRAAPRANRSRAAAQELLALIDDATAERCRELIAALGGT